MEENVKYAVFVSQKEDAVGYFLNNKYYEPFEGGRQLGHLDVNDNFIYYVVRPGSHDLKIHGKIEGDTLIRQKDGQRFQVQPA